MDTIILASILIYYVLNLCDPKATNLKVKFKRLILSLVQFLATIIILLFCVSPLVLFQPLGFAVAIIVSLIVQNSGPFGELAVKLEKSLLVEEGLLEFLTGPDIHPGFLYPVATKRTVPVALFLTRNSTAVKTICERFVPRTKAATYNFCLSS